MTKKQTTVDAFDIDEGSSAFTLHLYNTRILRSPWQVGQVTRLVNKQVNKIVVQPKRSSACQQGSILQTYSIFLGMTHLGWITAKFKVSVRSYGVTHSVSCKIIVLLHSK